MAKVKKHTHVVDGVYLKVKCPVTSKEIEIKLDPLSDFSHSEDECEMCGSHGQISIDYKCPECGEFHEYVISSW